MQIQTLQDLLQHELKDLYSAENQIIKSLPKMIKEASNDKLKQGLESHLEETREQATRLEEIAEQMGFKPSGHTCKAMKGLIEEASEMLKEDAPDEVKDAGIISQAQRIEHYEIAGYGTARTLAEQCGLSDVAKLLQKTLDEEKSADQKLTKVAESRVNQKAAEVH